METSFKSSYPQNLIDSVLNGESIVKKDCDVNESLELALSTIPERTAIILRMRYRDKISISKICREFSLSRSRIYQLIREGITKLHEYPAKNYIIYGKGYSETAKAIQTESIDTLGLSKRSVKSLTDAGITKIIDLSNTSIVNLNAIKGIGKSSIDSIAKSLSEYGIILAEE